MKFNFSDSRNQKRRNILLISTLLFNLCLFPAVAKANKVLQCLGREELRLHRKRDIGPRYKLNQVFLNKLSSNSISIKEKYRKQICRKAPNRPSLTLLKILMLKQRDLFDIKVDKNRLDGLVNFKISQADEFVAQASNVFFSYVSGIQAMAPTADCLNKKIPALPKLFKRFNYLQEEVSAKELLKDKKAIREIFKGLENLDSIFTICEREKNKKS